MADFNVHDETRREDLERFPAWVIGYDAWRKWFGEGAWKRENADESFDALLADLRAEPAPMPACPRLFVSHRHADKHEALRVAWIANSAGFEFWLDVLDPQLNTFGGAKAPPLVIASIIELALLNCTHVIALLTDNTPGTMWVPYEYGRVKERSRFSRKAACWLDPRRTKFPYTPEYAELGPRHKTESAISNWLARELTSWQHDHKSCHGGAQNPWHGGATRPLPRSSNEAPYRR